MDVMNTAGASGGRTPSPKGEKVHMSQDLLERMFQKRELERKDELKQIESLGKVRPLS